MFYMTRALHSKSSKAIQSLFVRGKDQNLGGCLLKIFPSTTAAVIFYYLYTFKVLLIL